jgi:hypothetical protein
MNTARVYVVDQQLVQVALGPLGVTMHTSAGQIRHIADSRMV